MQTIWKYQLTVEDKQVIEIPQRSKLLSVQTQFDIPCIWVGILNTELPKETITILTFGTGNPILGNIDHFKFLGTYQIMGGSLVFHVFYRYDSEQ